MRLFYSAGSPFARVVRVALLETGLDARVRKQEIARPRLYSAESDVLAVNPVGRVPTLELDDGTILTESKYILDYLDTLHPGPQLLPRDGSDGWRILAETGQAWGLLEGIVTWLRGQMAPDGQRPVAAIAWETARANRAVAALEAAVANGAYAGPLNAAQIVLGVALGFADVRLPAWNWRDGHATLASWYDTIARRPAFAATTPPAG